MDERGAEQPELKRRVWIREVPMWEWSGEGLVVKRVQAGTTIGAGWLGGHIPNF
jgi:hypothetical protein